MVKDIRQNEFQFKELTDDDLYRIEMEKTAKIANRYMQALQDREDAYFCRLENGLDEDDLKGNKDKRDLKPVYHLEIDEDI